MFRRDPAQTGVADGALGDEFEVAWTFEAGGAIVSSPVVVGGRVYFGCDDQKIHCLRFSDGKELWAHETEDIIEAPPMVHEGVVYCGSSDFYMYAVDALTGERLWRYETDDRVLGGAAAVPGPDGATHIIFGSYDTHLYCLDDERSVPVASACTGGEADGSGGGETGGVTDGIGGGIGGGSGGGIGGGIGGGGAPLLRLRRLLHDNYGTFAYVVSPRGAAQLLASAYPLTAQIDSHIARLTETNPSFVALAVEPSLVTHLHTLRPSDVQQRGS